MKRLLIPALALCLTLLLLQVQPSVPQGEAPAPIDSTAVLWLARGAWHETRPRLGEAAEVMWVIRRRAEQGYRGKHTIKGVLLDPAQFTGFPEGQRLTWDTHNAAWQRYLDLAIKVLEDSVQSRLDDSCLHFINPQLASPAWVTDNPQAVGRLEFHCGVH